MTLVLDASVALAWCFDDELDAAALAALGHVTAKGAVVPSVFFLEVGNALLVGQQRGRLTEARTEKFTELLLEVSIASEELSPEGALKRVLSLAKSHGLATCDATYLDLAMREGLALATKDRKLATVARRVGVPLAYLEEPLGR